MERIWPDETLAKKEQVCIVCGSPNVELAHVTKRVFDKPRTPGSKTVYVEPESVVPLCGPFPEGCHGAYDAHELDIVSYLETPEQVRAVEDYGSLLSALVRLAPSIHRQLLQPAERKFPGYGDSVNKEEAA